MKRVFKTKKVNDEIFAVLAACASVLTECQDYNDHAFFLASNVWNLYHQLGGHERFVNTAFERLLKSRVL